MTRESSSEQLGVPTIISILDFTSKVVSVSPKMAYSLLCPLGRRLIINIFILVALCDSLGMLVAKKGNDLEFM